MRLILLTLFISCAIAHASPDRLVKRCSLNNRSAEILLAADQGFNFGEDYYLIINGKKSYLINDANHDAMPELLAVTCEEEAGFFFVAIDSGSAGLGILYWNNKLKGQLMEMRFGLRSDSIRVAIRPDEARVFLLNNKKNSENILYVQKGDGFLIEKNFRKNRHILKEPSREVRHRNYQSSCTFSRISEGNTFSGRIKEKTDHLARHVARNEFEIARQKRFVSRQVRVSELELEHDRKSLSSSVAEYFFESEFLLNIENNESGSVGEHRPIRMLAKGKGVEQLCLNEAKDFACTPKDQGVFELQARLTFDDKSCPGRARIALSDTFELTIRENADGSYFLEQFSDYWTRLYSIERIENP